MKTLFLLSGLLLGVAGCGQEGHEAIADPSKLPPLTAADHEEIRQREAQVADEERGRPAPPARKSK